tara:strand:- start:3436 stop:3987 length:552 start_codon:yes stop_codon:yes gene_type:complete
MTNREQIGHSIGYAGASILFLRFVPLLYEQFTKPREMNIFFLNLELLASVFCGTSAMFLGAIPLFIANSLSFVCLTIILLIQYIMRYKKRTKSIENLELEEASPQITPQSTSQSTPQLMSESTSQSTPQIIRQIDEQIIEEEEEKENETEKPNKYCKFIPLFKLQKPEKPEKITQIYNTIARN